MSTETGWIVLPFTGTVGGARSGRDEAPTPLAPGVTKEQEGPVNPGAAGSAIGPFQRVPGQGGPSRAADRPPPGRNGSPGGRAESPGPAAAPGAPGVAGSVSNAPCREGANR